MVLGRQLDQQLKRVDALEPGGGYFDAGAVLRGNAAGGIVGAAAELGWRAADWLSLGASADVGYGWGANPGLQYGAQVFGRGRW